MIWEMSVYNIYPISDALLYPHLHTPIKLKLAFLGYKHN